MDDDGLSRQLAALGNPTRLAIVRALVRAGHGGLSVGTLQARLGTAPSTLSHHLGHLRQAGLVLQERQGTTLLCRAEFGLIAALVRTLRDECCIDERDPP